MSIKQNFPTIDPTLNLDFAGSQAVDSRIQFTRASAATVTDAQGVLQTLRDNKPRIDFDGSTGECRGLLIEEQRTNLIIYSNDPDYSSWTLSGASIAKNIAIAPDGTMSADKIVENTATTTHGHYQTLSVSNSTLYTWSAYFKAAERTSVMVYAQSSRTPTAIYNLSTGTVSLTTDSDTTAAATITPAGNGWYRCTITATTVGTTAYFNIAMVVSGNQTYAGNGSSGLFVWGAQFEAGSFATSYVPSATTFTSRASSATYFDATGVLRTAPAGGARYGFGYDSTTQKWVSQGLILEAAATNLMPYSEQFEHSTWSKSYATVSPNSSTAPDGSLNAEKISEDSTTAPHQFSNSPSISLNTTYTLSIYAKAVERSWIILNIYSGTTSCWTWFNISTGAIGLVGSGATARIESVGNGWFRCSLTATTAASGNPNVAFWVSNADNSINYTGTTGSGILVWGAQFETGTVATSYIPTPVAAATTRAADVSTSAATTRSRDNAEMYNIDQSWFKNSEGSFYAEGYHSARNSSSLLAVVPGINNTWTAGMMQLSEFNAGSTSGFRIYTSINGATAAGQIDPGVTTLSTGVNHKFAGAWRTNDAASSVNTTAISTDNTVILPGNLSTLKIGSSYDSGFKLNGCIKKITYYPIRLSNTQLQALTV